MIQTAVIFCSYCTQTFILAAMRNYTLVLAVGICATVLMNYLFSIWITHMYPDIFRIKTRLPKDELNEIYKGTTACMLHNVGGRVKNATDSIAITKCVSLLSAGLYSNYLLILNGMSTVVKQTFGNFLGSLGNAYAVLSVQENYQLYKRLLFLNLWVAGVTSVCLYSLMDDFIVLWLGDDMTLSWDFTLMICTSFYIDMSRVISMRYTNACGLFIYDRWRPIIEAMLNLLISVVCAYQMGVAGVVLGTVISALVTVVWREPYILIRKGFQTSTAEYWGLYLKFAAMTILAGVMLELIDYIIPAQNDNMFVWIGKGLIAFATSNILFLAVFHSEQEFLYYRKLLINKIKNRKMINTKMRR